MKYCTVSPGGPEAHCRVREHPDGCHPHHFSGSEVQRRHPGIYIPGTGLPALRDYSQTFRSHSGLRLFAFIRSTSLGMSDDTHRAVMNTA
ncbi:hypothetical protein LF1_42460 [Rubripirellula obstinata]|uniref:Uncharacterized protein n=1 Tax=Rubripirellula obstinata TaxID=406547 RepID=A0A5B1CN19_9BACT|nr:hypothetical protein LF1_42460 [Rubripirellula obstinata]